MRPAWKAAVLMTMATILATACGSRGDDRAIPRPEAYPRISMPDSSYTLLDVRGTKFEINSAATVDSASTGTSGSWITLFYPGVDCADIYLTLSISTPDSILSMMDNRRQRMSLNLSGSKAILTELTSAGGWEAEMITGSEALSTPVQILARKDDRMLSGTLYLRVPPATDPDSVRPITDAAGRDMLTLLKSLR